MEIFGTARPVSSVGAVDGAVVGTVDAEVEVDVEGDVVVVGVVVVGVSEGNVVGAVVEPAASSRSGMAVMVASSRSFTVGSCTTTGTSITNAMRTAPDLIADSTSLASSGVRLNFSEN